jgi:hypothetical protein
MWLRDGRGFGNKKRQYMRTIFTLLFLLSLAAANFAIADETPEIRMSAADVFRLEAPSDWKVEVKKCMPVRFASVQISPLRGYDFVMMLIFKCEANALAQSDAPEKMAQAVKRSFEKRLPRMVEKEVVLQPVPVKSTYGFYTILTDAELVGKTTPTGEYRHMTGGMVRLSKDSALVFTIGTNDVDSEDYRKLLNYVYGFIKSP